MPFFRRRGGREDQAEARPLQMDEVRRRVLAAAPTAGPRLVEEFRPAVRFATCRQPDAAMDIGVSKLGGAPDLPLGTRWPMWTASEGEQRPLQFFAQVNLAAAAAVAPGPLGLPAEGQLSFFGDLAGTGEHAAVLYSAADSQFVRCSPRVAPLPSGQLHPLGTWTWPADVAAGTEIPEAERRALDVLRQEIEAQLRAGLPERWLLDAHHQLGGHSPRPVGGSGDRQLLLQLDSDETLEVSWGGGGTVVWTTRSGDLEAGRWGGSVFELQCR